MYGIDGCAALYVSPSRGDDGNTGLTPDAAFKTPARAVSEIKRLREAGNFRPMTVFLTEDVFLEAPLVLDADGVTLDGGGHRVIGGVPITGWREDSLNGAPCVSAALPDGCPDFTDLWADGRRADPPRFPESGFLYALAVENESGRELADLYDNSKSFTADQNDLSGVEGIEDAQLNFYHYWIDEHTPIESYDRQSGRLVMKYASRFRVSARKDDPAHIRYYLTGVRSGFGAAGGWYLDRKARRVYYAGKVKEALVPTLPRLVEIRGRDVRVRGAILTCTRGEYKSEGTPDGAPGGEYAADIQSVCNAPGAVLFENAVNCALENCRLSGVGVHGVEILTGCRAVRIENCVITDTGAGGIKIFGGAAGEPEELETADCAVRGCEISDCGRRYEAGCGILACHTSRLEISDCTVHGVGYSGISVGWVWGYSPSSTFGCLIRRNHIYDIGRGVLSDMGGIYLLGEQRGTFVEYNRIHGVRCADYGGWGIYTDEGSGCVTVENNVVFDTQDPCFFQHYGKNVVVRNNIFVSKGGCAMIGRNEPHRTVIFENNVCDALGAPAYRSKRGGIDTVSARNNLFSSPRITEDTTLEEWQSGGRDAGSMVGDPMFADPANGDFTVSADSPAVKLGFVPFAGFPAKSVKSC